MLPFVKQHSLDFNWIFAITDAIALAHKDTLYLFVWLWHIVFIRGFVQPITETAPFLEVLSRNKLLGKKIGGYLNKAICLGLPDVRPCAEDM